MAGVKGRSGRKLRPELLKFTGEQGVDFEKPSFAFPAAAELWDELYPMLRDRGVLTDGHRAVLVAHCLNWGFVLQSAEIAAADPLDKSSHTRLATHQANFMRTSKVLGLTPFDEQRIKRGKKSASPTAQGIEARKRG